jgi:hypothetical protein
MGLGLGASSGLGATPGQGGGATAKTAAPSFVGGDWYVCLVCKSSGCLYVCVCALVVISLTIVRFVISVSSIVFISTIKVLHDA